MLASAGEYRTAIELAPDSWEFQSLTAEPDESARQPSISLDEGKPLPRQPPELRYADHKASFQFRGTAGEAYETVGEEFGVRVIFDQDFDADRTVRADLSECSFGCAMRVLGAITGSLQCLWTVTSCCSQPTMAESGPSWRRLRSRRFPSMEH